MNAEQTLAQKFWLNILKPGFIYLGIAAVCWTIGFGCALAGSLFNSGSPDRKLEAFRGQSVVERHRIEGLNSQIRTIKARFAELDASNRRFEAGYSEIGLALDRVSAKTTDNIEQLRRIIEALQAIQKIVGTMAER